MTQTTLPTPHLTRYTPGSLQELWHISLPLMLTALSGSLMLFCDRLILARYSLDAMNAATSAGMVCSIFQFGVLAIASIAEVFVGQYNGSKKFQQLGEPVWQMIWFSAFASLLFLPLAFFAGPFFLPERYHELGIPYYQWIMGFGSVLPMVTAVASFYIGQGRVKLVTFAAIIGNVANLLLGIALVFGIKDFIPTMGTLGAAIATVIAELIQLGILLYVFLNRHNRTEYGTKYFAFKLAACWQCIRIGLPNAIGHMIEIAAWASLLYMLAWVSDKHVTILSIGQSVYVLFAFASDGVQKGVIAVASNFLGAKKPQMISKVFRSSLLLAIYIIAILAIPMLIAPHWVVSGFVASDLPAAELTELRTLAEAALFWIWIYFIFDIVVWLVAGILTAAGDTLFIMTMNAINAWLFAIVPVYFFVVHLKGSPTLTWQIMTIYIGITLACFLWRYHSGKWRKLKLITA